MSSSGPRLPAKLWRATAALQGSQEVLDIREFPRMDSVEKNVGKFHEAPTKAAVL